MRGLIVEELSEASFDVFLTGLGSGLLSADVGVGEMEASGDKCEAGDQSADGEGLLLRVGEWRNHHLRL